MTRWLQERRKKLLLWPVWQSIPKVNPRIMQWCQPNWCILYWPIIAHWTCHFFFIFAVCLTKPLMGETLHWSDNWMWKVTCWHGRSSKIIILLLIYLFLLSGPWWTQIFCGCQDHGSCLTFFLFKVRVFNLYASLAVARSEQSMIE